MSRSQYNRLLPSNRHPAASLRATHLRKVNPRASKTRHESMLIAPEQSSAGSAAKLKVDWKRALGVQRLPFRRRRSRPEREVIERLRKLGLVRGRFSIEPNLGRALESQLRGSNRRASRISSGSARSFRSWESTAATRSFVTRPPASAASRRRSFITSAVCSSPGSSKAERLTRSQSATRPCCPALAALLGHLHEGWDRPDRRGPLFLRVPDRAHLRPNRGPAQSLAAARHRSDSRRHHGALRGGSPRFGRCFATTI